MLGGLALLAGLARWPVTGAAPFPREVTFRAADGVAVYGDLWAVRGRGVPLVLLFHQTQSNRAEYATVGPRLARAGCAALAIDQRVGGTMFGRENRTGRALYPDVAYEQAWPDLEGALRWARRRDPGGPVIVWGSSYSASLALRLAARHPREVAAVLAFSPGEYVARDRSLTLRAAAGVHVPLLIAAMRGHEEAQARRLLAASPSERRRLYVSGTPLVHGALMLRSDVNTPQGARAAWAAVAAFLSPYCPGLSRGGSAPTGSAAPPR
ncbi:serine aminopeptidase domain-containing protein [Deinococcus budaensis]|uniref:Dienelactone hydrolase n=1 Tax=Deinococcus budaensis TaxID=1665626 RepID=A0A7W8GCV2_9DEIO|nr:dienelactone hydrolase [Deinococcus budaensis]